MRMRLWAGAFTAICLALVAVGPTGAYTPRKMVAGFDTASDIASMRIFGPGVRMKLNTAPAFIHQGTGSLEIIADESKNPRKGGVRPTLRMTFSRSIDLKKYREMTLWVYVPKSAAAHFFGRYDVRLAVNRGNPYWSMADVSPGWNHVVWNFARHPQNAIAGSGSGATRFLPKMRVLQINFGPLMNGYGLSKIYVDDLRLVPMRRLVSTTPEELESVLGNDDSWSRRYQAVGRLRAIGGLKVLPAIMNATEDHVPLVRGAAWRAMEAIVRSSGKSAWPDLLDALHIGTPRQRIAVVHLVSRLGVAEMGKKVIPVLQGELLDNDYYTRSAARQGLVKLGVTEGQIAIHLAGMLQSPDGQRVHDALRVLADIGPAATPALPAILKVLRNSAEPLVTRQWALRAAWWTNDHVLKPADWIVGLKHGAMGVYRHLPNLAMIRLEAAGVSSVGILSRELLGAKSPVVRARAAEAFSHMRPAVIKLAAGALQKALHDSAWYVAWQAGRDLHRAGLPVRQLKPLQVRLAGAPVTVVRHGDEVILANGKVRMVFDKTAIDPGPVSVQLDGGTNMVHSRWVHHILAFRHSKANNMFERQWLQKVGGSPINKHFVQAIIHRGPEEAEYVYTFPADHASPFRWEEHYVLRRGNSGFYVYFVLRNMTGKAMPNSIYQGSSQSIGLEFNFLVAATRSLFTTKIMSDNLRGPTSFGFPRQNYLQYPDIYQATWRLPNGEVDAKHEWMNYERMSHVTGLVGPKYGLWLVFPSYSFLDGTEPLLQMTAFVGPLFIIGMDNKYYVPTATYVGAHWKKIYGPMYFYLDKGPNREEMWIAAKRAALARRHAWPLHWVKNAFYQSRGAVEGTVGVSLKKAEKDGRKGAPLKRAWVILSLPPKNVPADLYGAWLRNIGSFMYWTRSDANGHFLIKNVEPGKYDLFVWKSGILGEARRNGLVVKGSKTLKESRLDIHPLKFGKTVWQIGTPTRTVTQFRNGGNFHIWENYLRYGMNFPHGVNYYIGKSNAKKDWNYLQPAIVQGHQTPTTWNIHFNLADAPTGYPVLTLVCGGRYARMNVFANGQKIGSIHTNVGLQLVRTAPYGELIIRNFNFSRRLLHKGKNIISLSFASSVPGNEIHGIYRATLAGGKVARKVRQNWTSFMAYDCIRLSMAKTPPHGQVGK